MLRRILFSVAMVAMVGGARAADASVPVVGPTTYTGTIGDGRVLLGNSGGAFLDWNGTNYTVGGAGPLSFANSITQAGYAQHGILSITTPSTCTALSACASGSVTFTTAMTAATYECTANSETYPYLIEVSAKTTTAVTFEIYNLVAVSAAQTVPVDYSCQV